MTRNVFGTPARRMIARFPRRAFTVIELVMVVGVLSTLLAIVLPTIKTVRNAVQRRQAMAEATALAQAAIRYKTEYGFWPGQLESKNEPEGTVRKVQSDPFHIPHRQYRHLLLQEHHGRGERRREDQVFL